MDIMNISIIVPVFNESESLPLLHQSLHKSLDDHAEFEWEVIYVDDGSSDDSLQVLEKLTDNDPKHTTTVALRRNFGQTAAIAAGIDYSKGEIIVLMDADLQNDPADIHMMINKINQGYGVVGLDRKELHDTFITRRFPSHIANWLISVTRFRV